MVKLDSFCAFILLQSMALAQGNELANFMCLYLPFLPPPVNVFPPEMLVSHVGGRAEFTCLSSSRAIISISWLINGSFIEDLSTINAMEEFSTFAGGIGVLTFDNLALDLNMTTIRCRAKFGPNDLKTSTEATILLVQGNKLYMQRLGAAVAVFGVAYPKADLGKGLSEGL